MSSLGKDDKMQWENKVKGNLCQGVVGAGQANTFPKVWPSKTKGEVTSVWYSKHQGSIINMAGERVKINIWGRKHYWKKIFWNSSPAA